MPVPSLRLRLIGVFVVSALVVAAVIVIAVDRFSAEQLMDLMMDGSDSPEEAQLMFDEYVGRVLLIGAGVAVVLGSLTAMWFLRRVLRPLDRLAEATRAVAAGDFGTRVPPPPDPELRVLADAFNQMSASLERAETLRRALVEDVAHELRTPLTTLRGYTEALADGVVEPTSAMLRTVHEEIERLTRLVEELDRLSRRPDPSDGAQRTPLELAPIVARAVELVRPELTRRGITVDFFPDPDLPDVLAHPDDIAKVIGNLVQNAERYTDDDGGTIEIRLDREDRGVRAMVANTGTPIPPDELPLIWERLHRVDRSRSRASGGAGIGLAIVRQIVEDHGGHVGARSAAGRTEVWFSLPSA
jgi:signal transduction histidine kinase